MFLSGLHGASSSCSYRLHFFCVADEVLSQAMLHLRDFERAFPGATNRLLSPVAAKNETAGVPLYIPPHFIDVALSKQT